MIPALIITAIIIGVVWYISVRKTGMERRASKVEYRYTEPSGLQVWIEEGAMFPNVTAIESALQKMFERAAQKGYQNHLSLDKYIIVVIKPDEYDTLGFPAFRLPSGAYAGTGYDKGKYILASGQFVVPNMIVIPSHTDKQVDHLKDVIEHEAIHAILFSNNKEKFEATRIHRSGEDFSL